jgi:hypothetical protein
MGPCDSGGSTLRCVHPFPAVVRSSRLNRGGAVRSHQRTTLKSNLLELLSLRYRLYHKKSSGRRRDKSKVSSLLPMPSTLTRERRLAPSSEVLRRRSSRLAETLHHPSRPLLLLKLLPRQHLLRFLSTLHHLPTLLRHSHLYRSRTASPRSPSPSSSSTSFSSFNSSPFH